MNPATLMLAANTAAILFVLNDLLRTGRLVSLILVGFAVPSQVDLIKAILPG